MVVTVVNAAISAAYSLRIIATMFLRSDPMTVEAMVEIVDSHTRVGDAIEQRDPIAAAAAMLAVIDDGLGRVRG